jgi:hypothetical protein
MNLTYLFKKSFVVALLITLTCGLLQAQSRYKHLPRVKIKKTAVESISKEIDQPIMVNSEVKSENIVVTGSTEITNVADAEVKTTFGEKTIASTPAKKRSVQVQVKKDVRPTFSFIPMTHKKLFKPETTNKANVSIALILLIVFYILAAIFTILCVLAIYLWANFSMFIVFLILAIVFGLAGSVLSLLLKFGVVN